MNYSAKQTQLEYDVKVKKKNWSILSKISQTYSNCIFQSGTVRFGLNDNTGAAIPGISAEFSYSQTVPYTVEV
jgi:hypothetical protein